MTDGPTSGDAPKRRGVKKADRDRIGERDGWICCICGKPVDKDRVWQKPEPLDPVLVAQAVEILADGVDERITQWAGMDVGRARAARSVWPRNPYSEAFSMAFTSLQELRTELAELKYPYTRDEVRKVELLDLIAEAEKTCSTLLDKVAEEYDRRHPHRDALESLCAAYRARNRDCPSVEHRVPVIAGGTNEDENLAIAHFGCNLSRGGNAQLIADLMTANRHEIPLEGRAAFLEDLQRHRDEVEQRRRDAEIQRQKWAQALRAAMADDDELRRELRRLGDRLRKTLDEKERRKIQNRRGSIKAKREKLRSKIGRLKGEYRWMSEEDILRQLQLAPETDARTEPVAGVVAVAEEA